MIILSSTNEYDTGNFKIHRVRLHISERRQKLIDSATPFELAMRRRLSDLRVEFDFQKPFQIHGLLCFVDFFLSEQKLCLEVDGGIHRTKRQQNVDKKRSHALHSIGLSVLRVKNEDVESADDAEIREMLSTYRVGKTTWSPHYFDY